jgi:hypothetical protein
MEDVERLLRLGGLAQETIDALARWQAVLSSLVVDDDREHLFGSHLLRLCREARKTAPAGQGLNTLIERLAKDASRYTAVLQATAEYLLAAAKEGKATEVSTAPVEQPAGQQGLGDRPQPDVPDWAHLPSEERPPAFAFGPLTGKNITLAQAICPHFNYEPDVRALHRLGKAKEVWIVRVEAQLLKIYFKDQPLYAQCNSALYALRDKERAAQNSKPVHRRSRKKQEQTK